jgi:hypothetical protein
MQKKKLPVISIVLFVLAGLLVIYSIWAAIFTADIIKNAVAMGQLVFKGNEFEVVSFYMTNIAQYALFAVVLFALGWILWIISPESKVEMVEEIEIGLSEETLSEEVEDVVLVEESEEDAE